MPSRAASAHVLDEILGQPPDDCGDDGRVRAPAPNVVGRLARPANPLGSRAPERRHDHVLEPFRPQVGRDPPRGTPCLDVTPEIEREGDERETGQADTGRQHVQIETFS